MPVQVSYPGVYVEEISSGVRTITGVATSITAFIGRALRGPVNDPVTISSYGDFERQFGGLGADYPLSYAVQDFFLNGGGQAVIVRLEKNSAKAKNADVKLEAASPGTWGNTFVYVVDAKGITDDVATRFGIAKADLFNLTIYENPGKGAVPEDVTRCAAELAAWYSKARNAGRVEVHVCRAADVKKARGAPAGQVQLARYKSIKVTPAPFAGDAGDAETE